ncbi:MAG: sugar ABC transporter permease [Chloroflexi bacterium]|nr:MAG: sugar ABC transporter permease [Chloroflexota bacterium]
MAVREMPVVTRRSWRRRVSQNRIAYAFLAPAVTLMVLIHLIPTLQALYMSLLNLRQENLRQYLRAPFVGLRHYQNILIGLFTGTGSSYVQGLAQALSNTFIFAFVVNAAILGLGLVLALLLNREFVGRGLARTLILLPWIVPTFVAGLIFRYIFLQEGGLANRILVDWLGVMNTPTTWLVGPNARWALIIAAVWRGVPLMSLMLLAGLQVIPGDLYEAAGIDGASAWQRFRYITLPMLKPIIAIQLMFGMVFNFFGFGPYNIAVAMFGGLNLGTYADLLIPTIARQTFTNQLYSYGAAASVLMMLVAMGFVVAWYRIFRDALTAQ